MSPCGIRVRTDQRELATFRLPILPCHDDPYGQESACIAAMRIASLNSGRVKQ